MLLLAFINFIIISLILIKCGKKKTKPVKKDAQPTDNVATAVPMTQHPEGQPEPKNDSKEAEGKAPKDDDLKMTQEESARNASKKEAKNTASKKDSVGSKKETTDEKKSDKKE